MRHRFSLSQGLHQSEHGKRSLLNVKDEEEADQGVTSAKEVVFLSVADLELAGSRELPLPPRPA